MINTLVRRLLIIALLFTNSALASALSVDDLLKEQQAPAGVVFEIISGRQDELNRLLPELKKDIERLRTRFPDLSIAIVSHGQEQFALTSNNSQKAKVAHDLVKQLVNEDRIKVHVCETHASWRGISAEDFPDYVDVSPTGPAQINDYLELDYKLIVLP